MPFFNGIYVFLTTWTSKLWPANKNLKRPYRDSVSEDEDEDILSSCETLSKRPRWMTKPYPSKAVLANDRFSFNRSPNQIQVQRVKSKKNMQAQTNTELKENKPGVVEIVELENDVSPPLESRTPLSNLSVVKCKSKPETAPTPQTPCHGVIRRPSHERLMQSRANSFTSSQLKRRTTALNESISFEDMMTYSKLLEEYHRSPYTCGWFGSSREDLSRQRSKQFPLVPSLSVRSTRGSNSVRAAEVIDLTEEERPNVVNVSVKPYQPSQREDEVTILEHGPVTRINSLEKTLSAKSVVDPDWITEMQRKYNEREREARRRLEEERLKKEIYSKHNQAKLTEGLDERIRRHLRLTEVVLDDTEEVSELPELTTEMLEKVKQSLRPNPATEVLVSAFGLQIKRCDIQTLKGLNWLNDEVINFYMNLIIERGKQDKHINVYAFSTFFYPKLISSQGYSGVRRWTKKVDIFAHDLVLAPIHLGVHWCMAIIDFRDKTVKYYDSMGSSNDRCLQALQQYLVDEHMDKKKETYDISGWTTENVKGIPQQMNGSDCGMFACMFAEYVSRNVKITFSQREMPYFRQKMIYEIVTKQLLL